MCRSNYVNFCTIDLSAFQEITDTGLLALGSCGLLQSIDISCCFQVTYAGVRALGARCGLLQRINITNCRQMTDAVYQRWVLDVISCGASMIHFVITGQMLVSPLCAGYGLL